MIEHFVIADELADRIETDGPPEWDSATTLANLAKTLQQTNDENVKKRSAKYSTG